MNPIELENLITRPSEELVADVSKLEGDIMVLGAGGKMGPSLCRLLQRTISENNISKKIFAVSRFSNIQERQHLENLGIEVIKGDLLDEAFLRSLPQSENILYLVGHKFGTQDNQSLTWAMNTYLPGRVADTFKTSRVVAFSSGNIYPFVSVEGFGADEKTAPDPIGEYAQSCLGRERMFTYFSQKNKTPVLIYRLNYALDLRYGVLNDLAMMVFQNQEVDLSMGYVNVIWQGDANEYAIRCLNHCTSPPTILNITGPEKLSVKYIAERFGQLFDRTPKFKGEVKKTALLNDARIAHNLFGKPKVTADQLIDWTADWIKSDGTRLNKPTHFQERKGNF